jgi:hypothetical protein
MLVCYANLRLMYPPSKCAGCVVILGRPKKGGRVSTLPTDLVYTDYDLGATRVSGSPPLIDVISKTVSSRLSGADRRI